eukprot:TRINITY_DN13567_c0_g1_i3.p1 TRINITY_DN13567_c0_g1~~TRINITY_DN13567_c0_g1_i3.p1  ORF type:complete len:519 (-),score=95.54 TRINITY_DN13567_c0_g1_i3:21-1577(-)
MMDVKKWILFGIVFWWVWGYSIVACAVMLYYLYSSIPETNGQINPLKNYNTIRALDGNEELYAKVETYLSTLSQTHTCIVHGPLTIPILRKALLILQKQYQVLRVGIHITHGTYYFHEFTYAQDLINVQVFEREDEFHWQKLMKIEGDRYRTVISEDKLLWKVIFLENRKNPSGPHEILLICMHALFDGTSRMVFNNALLTICGDLIDGKDIITREEIPLFKGPRELLFGNGNNHNLLDWKAKYLPEPMKAIAYNLKKSLQPKLSPGHPLPLSIKPPISRSSCFKALKMPKTSTRSFYLACKEHNVTFHSGFCAAITVAAQKTWNLPAVDAFKLVIPVRLREKCKPQVRKDEICFCIGSKEMFLPLHNLEQETLWNYAQYINNHLHNNEDSDKEIINAEYAQKYLSDVFGVFSPLVRYQSKEDGARISHFLISNLGLLPYSTQFGKQLHLEGWFTFLKERYMGNCISHSLATIDNECCITTFWTDGVMNSEEMQTFHKELVQILEHLTGQELFVYPSQ